MNMAGARTPPAPEKLQDRQGLRIAELSPANFAMVMATGIIGVDAHQQGHELLGDCLLAIGLVAWAVLAALNLARFAHHRSRMLADLRSHARAPGFLSWAAATAVMGSLWLVIGLHLAVGEWLAALAAVLWAACTYGVLIALTLQREKPGLAEGINGAWLLVVVATQSIAVVAVMVGAAPDHPLRLALDFTAAAMWLCGGMIYVWLISLIFYRYAFLRLAPEDFTPTYWINMGAMAISSLAGALLVKYAPGAPFLAGLLPVLKGGTLLYWAVGTWWLPLLVGLAAWRYVRAGDPLRYEVGYWGAVFPLGMYSAATRQMALSLDVPFLLPLARGFFYVAVAAWVLTAFGLAGQVVRGVKVTRA
jgi:tellurite resistance protein TehA-like permease